MARRSTANANCFGDQRCRRASDNIGAAGTGFSSGKLAVINGGTFRYTGSRERQHAARFMDGSGAATAAYIDVANASATLTMSPNGGTRNTGFVKQGAGTLVMNGAIRNGIAWDTPPTNVG